MNGFHLTSTPAVHDVPKPCTELIYPYTALPLEQHRHPHDLAAERDTSPSTSWSIPFNIGTIGQALSAISVAADSHSAYGPGL